MKLQTFLIAPLSLVLVSLVSVGFILLSAISVLAQSPTPFSIGETVEIHSDILSEKRVLNMYLPAGYHADSVKACDAIYLLDGSAHEDFLHIVGLVQFFNLQMGMPPTIVVGIGNVDRKRDFTYHTDDKEYTDYCPTCGESEQFIRFLKEELQPYINANYKVNERRILIGQSLGGLLASEILFKDPNLFTDYLIVSPSIWWDNESLLKQGGELFEGQSTEELQVYVSVGAEGRIMIRGAKGVHRIVRKAGKENLTLHFKPLKKENHATILHESIYQAFKIMYPYQEPE